LHERRAWIARERRSPHLARLGFIATAPEHLTQMCSDVAILAEGIGMLEDRRRTARIAAPKAHPAQTVEHRGIVGRGEQRAPDEFLGTRQLLVVICKR